MNSSGPFALPNSPQKVEFCENFPKYPSEISTIRISTIVYFIPQHFSQFKNYKVLIPKLVPRSSSASAKTIRALFGTDLLLVIRMVARKGFHFGRGIGRWATILWGLDTSLTCPNFLSLLATREVTRIYHVYK